MEKVWRVQRLTLYADGQYLSPGVLFASRGGALRRPAAGGEEVNCHLSVFEFCQLGVVGQRLTLTVNSPSQSGTFA